MGNSLEIGKNAYHFIVIIISNPDKSSHDKYHKLSFVMSQTWFVYFTDPFGAKMQNF
jgi:hypothetical protein